MRLFAVITPLLIASSALAQGVIIATPTSGEDLTIGAPFTVEVDKPDFIDFEQSVSVVIGLQLCASDGCSVLDNDERLGQILFAGDYSPQFHQPGKPPYQNFTVTAPSGVPPQSAVLHVIHFVLLGAGPFADLQAVNVTVNLTQ